MRGKLKLPIFNRSSQLSKSQVEKISKAIWEIKGACEFHAPKFAMDLDFTILLEDGKVYMVVTYPKHTLAEGLQHMDLDIEDFIDDVVENLTHIAKKSNVQFYFDVMQNGPRLTEPSRNEGYLM